MASVTQFFPPSPVTALLALSRGAWTVSILSFVSPLPKNPPCPLSSASRGPLLDFTISFSNASPHLFGVLFVFPVTNCSQRSQHWARVYVTRGQSFGEHTRTWSLLTPTQPLAAGPALEDDAGMSSLTAMIPQRAHLRADYRAQVISLISNYQ